MQVVSTSEVHFDLDEFIKGRLSLLLAAKSTNEQPCTPQEKALFRSAFAHLHWVSSHSRPDCAVYTSRLQKAKNSPALRDYLKLAKTLLELRDTASEVLKIKVIEDPVVVVWTVRIRPLRSKRRADDFVALPMERQAFYSQGGH